MTNNNNNNKYYDSVIKQTIKKTNRIINSNSSNNKKVNRMNKLIESIEFDSIKKTNRLSTFNMVDINVMLKSNAFTLNERKALSSLIKNSKINILNENTAKLLDDNCNVILELDIYSYRYEFLLSEGMFTNIWNDIKKIGDKAKYALKSGWSKLKTIWSEFSELVKEVGRAILDGFKKLYDYIKGKVTAMTSTVEGKVTDKLEKSNQETLKKEAKQLSSTFNHWTEYMKKTFTNNTNLIDVIESGKFNVEKDIKLDDDDIDSGFKKLEKIADNYILTGKTLTEIRVNLLSNQRILFALIENKVNRLLVVEDGGYKNLEDSIKNEVLKNVIKYALLGAQWVIGPIGKILSAIMKLIVTKGLVGMSEGTKKLNGPGVFEFTVISAALGDIVDNVFEFESRSQLLAQFYKFIPVIGPMLGAMNDTIMLAVDGFVIYGGITIIYNLIHPFM